MKKVLSLIVLLVAFSSCETDVKFSDPGFQAAKDNLVWRADLVTASITGTAPDNEITIFAYRGAETVVLTFPVPVGATKFTPKTYTFAFEGANNDDISASYLFEDSGVALEYYAGADSMVEDQGNITIEVTEFDGEKMTLSGNFRFNAKYQGESEIVPVNVNFQEGFFYKVQIQ